MNTEVIYHELYQKKYAIKDFKERLEILWDEFKRHDIFNLKSVIFKTASPLDENEIAQTHHKYLISELKRSNWFDIAALSVGGAVQAAEDIIANKVNNAYVLIPVGGHHAGPNTHWGFCYLNETACIVERLRRKGFQKILYLDQDFHHADGTEKFFQYDKDFFYICLHTDRGDGSWLRYDKLYNHLDLSLPKGLSGLEYFDIMRNAAAFAIKNFKPDFIIAYVGYDGHFLDPFNNKRLKLDQKTYIDLMNFYKQLAKELTENRLLCICGGGYHPKENAIAIFNAIMVLSDEYDKIIQLDSYQTELSDQNALFHASKLQNKLFHLGTRLESDLFF